MRRSRVRVTQAAPEKAQAHGTVAAPMRPQEVPPKHWPRPSDWPHATVASPPVPTATRIWPFYIDPSDTTAVWSIRALVPLLAIAPAVVLVHRWLRRGGSGWFVSSLRSGGPRFHARPGDDAEDRHPSRSLSPLRGLYQPARQPARNSVMTMRAAMSKVSRSMSPMLSAPP